MKHCFMHATLKSTIPQKTSWEISLIDWSTFWVALKETCLCVFERVKDEKKGGEGERVGGREVDLV